MTNQHPITPPPELVQKWAHMLEQHTDTDVFTQAARWGDEQRLRACIELLDINGCPDRYIDMLRALLPKPQPSLKEQALEQALAKIDAILSDPGNSTLSDELEALELSRRALEQLRDAPAVTPPEPAAAPDRPLLELMWGAYISCNSPDEGMIAALRVVADELERRQLDEYSVVLPDVREVLGWLRAEAERAEAP